MEEDVTLYQLPPRIERVKAPCQTAVQYQSFVDDRFSELTGEEQPSSVSVLRCLVRLTMQFYYVRLGTEADHRDRVFEENGTRCLYGVYLEALDRWHELWLTVERLPVTDPPKPVRPPRPKPPPKPSLPPEPIQAELTLEQEAT